MKYEIEMKCKFCGAIVPYEVEGDLSTQGEVSKSINAYVEPCRRCTEDAMNRAWREMTKEYEEKEEDME